MAETIITKDGKCHTLLGSTTIVSIIQEYCGDEVADWVERQLDREERKQQSDIGAYEADLDHLHRMMQDWADMLLDVASMLRGNKGYTKDQAARAIYKIKDIISVEL